MDFLISLELLKQPQSLSNSFIVYFYSKTKQNFFFVELFNYYKTLGYNQVTFLSMQDTNFQQFKFILTSTFLSDRSVYFIKDFDLINSNNKNNLLSFLNNYSGPNLIFFYDTIKHDSLPSNAVSIEVPEKISLPVYSSLFNFFYPKFQFDPLFIQKAISKNNNLNLDQSCILMQYQISLGRKFDIFFDTWLEKIISSDYSLFILSQNLFAQDYKAFFSYWLSFKSDYPDEFWIPYFSEQLWQASAFVYTANLHGVIEAKKTAARLPFSFINKHWKNFNFSYLASAHNHLYLLDYNFKNSITQTGLDLWLNKFILNKF